MFKMEEANMIASLELYRSQLQQVEDALSISDSTQDLEKLKTDIMELISLTEESLLSIKKSQLLQLIENEDAELKSDGAIDKEYAAFQAAVADDEEIPTEIGAAESTKQIEIRPARDSDDEDDCEILEQLKNIIGMRCRVSYMQDWGMLDYHNALVVNTEPYHRSSPAKVTVMFSNPIHKSMLPCKFYLEGKCKFSEEDCKFSHGYTVDLQVLRPFKDPDYSSVVLGSKCLARYKDGLWYKAAIESVEDDHQFVVNYDFYKETCILDLEDILPLDSLGSDSDDDEEEKESFGSEIENELPFVLWEPPRTTTGLAEWEIHTKGIGSKLLAKMGYKLGQGLGKNGEGRAEPVPIQVLPAGKSLDKIMELKAIAKDQNLFDAMKKNKNMKRIQEKKNAAACSRVDAPNVFDFINRKLKGKKGNHSNPVPQHTVCHISHKELHRKTDHNLNVQLLKTEEEMKKVEKEIKSLEESLARHKNRNKSMTDHLQKKLESMKHYLSQLTTSQNAMEQHQKQRINHKKLTIF